MLFFVLMGLCMLVVLATLGTGLVVMARGGEANARYGNRLMQLRVAAQALAILFFALALLT